MSWKRIFRTARKIGAPVIIADENGKRPQVVLPLDIYEALIDEDHGFEVLDDSDFDEDFKASRYLEEVNFDEEVDDIPEIKFEDNDDGWNEAEYMNQYRKKRSEGYSDSEIVKMLDEQGLSRNDFGEKEPDEKAAPAFEFEDSLGSEELSPIEASRVVKIEDETRPLQENTIQNKKTSKSSEELAVEDRFYFEPLDDEEIGS